MTQDIDDVLQNWEYEPGTIQAREIEAGRGRRVIQMRVELGVLQLEKTGRPDGTRPNGFPTYFDWLKHEAKREPQNGGSFVLSEEQCQEADREFMQYYHRRICWLALQNYARALADADHTLAFMDFVRDHSPDEQYTEAHEQYRGFVMFQRTQAAAALRLEKNDFEGAIDEIGQGLAKLKEFFTAYEVEDQMEDNPMVQHLRRIEQSLRDQHGIEDTLQEQLAKAIANEEYEKAARLRDQLRGKRSKR